MKKLSKKLSNSGLSGSRSVVEYRFPVSKSGAGDEARTRDPLLGKQMLYH